MNNWNIRKLLTICVLMGAGLMNAQLNVDDNVTPQQMAESISGDNVEILNPVVTGEDGAYGLFEAQVDSFQLGQGILLTTGRLTNALGPNDTESKSSAYVGTNGDPKLDIISGYSTRDACKLEFDIIPAGDSLSFEFSFASEEYSEYVCTNFNDVFGFFISGPGIVGDPGLSGAQNIALIPGTNDPVTINDVNWGNPNQGSACPPVNPQFFTKNPLSPIAEIQYDGWTKNLIALAVGLIPCETYHLELIVADATDRLWDSGVFIEEIQSNNVVVEVATQGGNPVMYEACNNGSISFCLETISANDVEVTYLLHGTATNGTDYDLINSPDPDFEHTVTIPAGDICTIVDINTIDDGIGEPLEFIDIIVENPLCDNIILDSIRTFLYDSLEVFILGDDLLCLGESTTLNLDSGGTSFVWSAAPAVVFSPDNMSTEITITPTQTSLVTINTTIAACTAEDELLVQVSNMSLDFDIVGITCDDICDGSIDMTINNGVSPFNIIWDGIFNTEDLSDLCAGTYEVRIIDAAGCQIIEQVEVGLAPAIQVVITPIEYVGGFNLSCNGEMDGSIDVIILGGTAPFDTSYSAGPNGLGAGLVTVSISDANGCTAESSINLTEPDPLSAIIISLQAVECIGEETGSATIQCTGGSGNCASVLWFDGATLVNSGLSYSNVSAGTYTVNLVDENNCTGQITVVIPGPSQELSGSIVDQVNVACNGENTGSVEVMGQGGTIGVGSDYSYEWQDDLSVSPIRVGLGAGTYVVVISDDNGCELELPVVITEPTPLEVTIIIENDIQCEGETCGNALAVGSGGTPGSPSYTYEWETVPAGSSADFPQFSAAASFCDPGQYSITVTDANDCKADTIIDITIISPVLVATFDITDVPCAGDSTGAIDATVIGGVGPFTYLWSGGNCSQGPYMTEDIINACAGVWCVTITDIEGCSLDTCLLINEPPELDYFFEMVPTLCADNCSGSIDFTPVGGSPPYGYEWFGPVFPIDTSATAFDGLPVLSTSQDLNSLCKGQYLVILSDSLNCTFERRITVTAPEDLLILTDSISDYNGFEVSCPDACDGYIYITATGGTVNPAYDYQFTWIEQSLGFATQGMGVGADDLNGLCASEDTVGYEIIIVDDNDCIQNAFFVMEEPDELTFEFDVTDVSCSGFTDGDVTVTVLGGVPPYTITWENDMGIVISMTDSITDIGEGWYYVFVTDLNGCMGNDSVLVSTPNPLLVPIDFVPFNGFGVSCVNDCNGTAFSPVSGGTMPYLYEWSDTDCLGPYISTEPAALGGLCAGTYYLNVTDDQGCVTCVSIDIIQPDSILADNALVVDISCEGETDGSIDLMLTGGVPAYTVDWVPAVGSGQIVNGLGQGTYTALVSDLNDCAAQFEFDIEEPVELTAVAVSPLVGGGFNISCNGACDGSIELDINGGVGPYTVLWSGAAPVGGSGGLSFVNVVCAGTYTAIVTDFNGCEIEASITLTEPAIIQFAFLVEQPISCNGECDGQLSVALIGGVPPFDIVWNDPDMSTGPLTGDNLCVGTYCVTVTDANGCVENSCFVLDEPAVFTLTCTTSDVTCTGADDGSIDCDLAGGTLPYACTWTGPNGFVSNDEDLIGLAPGEYCVSCLDAQGCQVEECYTIGEPVPLVLTAVTSDYGGFEISCPGECDGSITLSATGGAAGYTFTPSISQIGLCAGLNPVSVEDALGCVASIDVILDEPELIDITLTSPVFDCGTNINCPGASTGSIFSTITGGVAGSFEYNWIDVANADTFNIGDDDAIDQLLSGQYELFVIDANGCVSSEFITLDQPTDTFTVDIMPSITPGGDNISCFEACDGAISFTANSACGDVVYSWFVGAEPLIDLTNLCPEEYTLVAIDGAECTYTDTLSLSEPTPLVVVDSVTQSLCANDDMGAIFLTVSGGSPDYSYDWDDPDLIDVEDQDNLDPGEYSVVVTDFNGCEETLDFVISEPDSLSLTLISPVLLSPDFNISVYLGSDGMIDAVVEGGTEPFTYNWTGDDGFSANTEDVSGLIAQNYCLELIDANGCVDGECIILTEPDDLELPNGMSPNGDGRNDGLIIQGIEAFPDNTVKVFNRWGDEIFEAKGYSNSNLWRGESDSGGIVPDGTYFVILVVKEGESKRELNAYLEVRR